MTAPPATLHLLCGKIASGKSSLCAKLAQAPQTVVIAEDAWLAALYGPEMSTVQDFVQYSARLQEALEPHIVSLLQSGLSVVLDFQANTPARRAWMRALIDAAGVDHTLHFLDTPDALCKARLARRNAGGTHPFTVTDAQFDQVTRHFVPPHPDEGFDILRHTPSEGTTA